MWCAGGMNGSLYRYVCVYLWFLGGYANAVSGSNSVSSFGAHEIAFAILRAWLPPP